ncbi:nitrogen regulation protein NR(I) [Orrella marina]|uniref:DNA-binding transcriptional regulator NtrC n=1 Tax=Orrella marina TaxID=2163011 RepID=A0A2R4XHR2_9BURK|nr:nitrogen regulation protein NR(I) [Orrella marina]AWB33259.1 nitrogen regulation protein NR(I) [Orrella marina]
MKPVWIVDDDQAIRWVLEKALTRAGIETVSFSSAQEVQTALHDDVPAALVSDIRMPGKDGLALLKDVKRAHPALPVIIMTAFGDLDSTVSAFQGGAFDYLPKPFDVNEAVSLISRAIQESSQAEPGAQDAGTTDGAGESSPKAMLTQSASPAMQEVFRAIGRLAQSNVTVLITGESGSGKELVARALHQHGMRSKGPFVALNTAAIPRDLLEAELFGHERGAFTGANTTRRGRFEEASGGTLFLDEIGDMPFELQTRLLRVLSDGTFYRVGGSQPVRADVRIVAATHQPLEERVREGKFREDLFHRLNVIRLRLPPLRERREDIEQLARHFLAVSANTLGVPVKRLSDAALDALKQFDFPGNVRQLENFCHWLTVMAPGQTINLDDLPPEIHTPSMLVSDSPVAVSMDAQAPVPESMTPGRWTDRLVRDATERLMKAEPDLWGSLTNEFERAILQAALDVCRGRRVEAAARLGMGRNTITRKLRELGMDQSSLDQPIQSPGAIGDRAEEPDDSHRAARESATADHS